MYLFRKSPDGQAARPSGKQLGQHTIHPQPPPIKLRDRGEGNQINSDLTDCVSIGTDSNIYNQQSINIGNKIRIDGDDNNSKKNILIGDDTGPQQPHIGTSNIAIGYSSGNNIIVLHYIQGWH